MSKKFLEGFTRDLTVTSIPERDRGSGMGRWKREKYRDVQIEKGNKDFQGRMHF